MVELILAISISTFLSIYAQSKIVQEMEESLAEGSAQYLLSVANAAQSNTLVNFAAYAAGTAVPGVAVPLQPTVPELIALGRLNAGFPTGAGVLPTRQDVRIDIQPTACPGASCNLQVLVCTTTPVTLGGATTRFDLASTMTTAQKGSGGQALHGLGATIRGPLVNAANPLGNVEGIVCSTSNVDTALFQRFVTIGDTRNPNLGGDLTVAGTTTLNGPAIMNGATTLNSTLTVNSTVTTNSLNVGPCINIPGGAQGNAGFGCANATDKPAAMAGVRSRDVIASGTVFTSDAPAGFTGSNGNYAAMRVAGGVAEIATSGRAAANRLTPTGIYTVGAACAVADDGSIARADNGAGGSAGLIFCDAGQWKPLKVAAVAGAACAVDGSQATLANGGTLICVGGKYRPIAFGVPNGACANQGETAYDSTAGSFDTLVCRRNPADTTANFRWARLRDVTTNWIFVTAYEVGDGDSIPKPTCAAAAGAPAALPLVQMIPKVVSTVDGGMAIFAIDSGPANWTARLRNGGNTVLTGNPKAVAVAQTFCYYL